MNKKYCYSYDGIDYESEVFDSVDEAYKEALENRISPTPIYICECTKATTENLINVDFILEDIGCNAYDEYGEYAEDYPDLAPEAKAELEKYLHTFFEKHSPPTFYNVHAETKIEFNQTRLLDQ